MSEHLWSMGNRPEETMDQVRMGIAEGARVLAALAERRDLTDEAYEFELRMQMMWLGVASNHWHEALRQKTQMLRMKELMERRISQ